MKLRSGIIMPGAAFQNVVPGLLPLKISTHAIYWADEQSGYWATTKTQIKPKEEHDKKTKRNYVSASRFVLPAAL